jgi:hypothetical protein
MVRVEIAASPIIRRLVDNQSNNQVHPSIINVQPLSRSVQLLLQHSGLELRGNGRMPRRLLRCRALRSQMISRLMQILERHI